MMSREETRRWMMTPSDRDIHLRCSIRSRTEGSRDGAYVAELLKRAVVMEGWVSCGGEHVGLATLAVRSPDVITLIKLLYTANPMTRSCSTVVPHVSSTL